ncbi:MAG: efflux RND transporter permease subunit [Myxococcota bacterium]|nr:efflux RND transporter permease subunit [Myxococcota bacterium]
MNIGEYSIQKRTVTLVLTGVACIAGMISYDNLGRLEDPEFTIKEALVFTAYPGASADDVDREVTNVLDRAIQRMGQIKRLESRSLRGMSIVKVVIKDEYQRDDLPKIWDEVRRKVTEAQAELPPGAGPTSIDDDFGDVYGVYVGVTGEGYTYRELKNYVDLLRRELLLVQDVKRIELFGAQPEAVYVEMNRERMAALGIPAAQIFEKLRARNLAADGGRVQAGPRFIAIDPTGVFASEQQFRDLLISEPGQPLVYLGDVAEVRRDYIDPPLTLLHMSYRTVRRDGELLDRDQVAELAEAGALFEDDSLEITPLLNQPAIGLAISTVPGGNVVTMGRALEARMEELEAQRPIGIELSVIALQSDSVVKAVNGFMLNLIQAIGIVVVVLFAFMGIRSALLIGFVLFVTIAATFIVMDAQGILLERISLGALIIALGMLVDNAIVVTEGMKVKIESGEPAVDAARSIVGQTQYPLLGATIVAIIAFAAIGLSEDQTGEYCQSLFYVLGISLLMSWVTAVTVTPLLCAMFFKPRSGRGAGDGDVYGGALFVLYRRLLETAMRFRYVTIAIAYGLFAAAVYGFTLLPPGFFPYSTRPQYMVDVWLPQDTHVQTTAETAARVGDFLMSRPNTKAAALHTGSGGLRFLLVYDPELPNSAYAQLLVEVHDFEGIEDDIRAVEEWSAERLPEALVFGKPFKLGPGTGGNIQLRLSGPDVGHLRDLAGEASQLLREEPLIKYVRSDWKEPVKVIRPVLAAQQARRNGILRVDVTDRIESSFQGSVVGVFREGVSEDEDRVLPVVSRAPAEERAEVDSIQDLQIYSPAARRMIPIRQVVRDFRVAFEDGLIFARNRRPTVTLHSDQTEGEAAIPFERVRGRVEAWFEAKRAEGEIDAEYAMEWGPEYEDSRNAQIALASSLPFFVTLMALIVVILFNNLRQPLVIWLTVPLAMVGVSSGLLAFDQPFNFMAILGTLSLVGMLIKNSIVLIDEINANEERGMDPYEGIVMAGVSRLRPVAMAAATTALGMLPLLTDIFFVSMALAIIFGLSFATLLTLLVVPTLTATFYGIPSPRAS